MRYNNYHRHSHYSNVSTIDCITKPEEYIKRALELGHTTVSSCEHRFGGNYFELYDLCRANNLKMLFVVEAYYVDDRKIKDASNWHIILAARSRKGFHQINRIISEANNSGFYYKPRIDLELLLTLNPADVIITTSCVVGRLSGENAEEAFLAPVLNHFGKSLFLEVQPHPHARQAQQNKMILELSQKYNIPIITGCDSHYIYPSDAKDRDLFLRGKGITYESEDGFILDYPDSDTIMERYKEQGILTEAQVIQSLKNTLVFDGCEDIDLTKEVKMPIIYPGVDQNKKLKDIINAKWKEEKQHVSKELHKKYLDAIRFEMDIVEKTDMAPYFLLNEWIVKKAVNEYGGILTRTGRGSAVSFYINKLLGFTEIDRLDADVPLYPTRFMSISRILESRSLPDIDLNWSDPIPAIRAAKDILGDDGCHMMLAYGTMQESSAFRNLCRAYDMEIDDFNDVAKDLDQYRENSKWKPIIEQSKKYIDVIESVSPSPCSVLMLDKPISEEVGLIKVGDIMCACIDGDQADVQKYLKNDFLTVRVWKIISATFKLIDKPIPNIRELNNLLDDRVWDIFARGLTACVNQVDTDGATPKVQAYKPKSPAELSAFVAAIRPGFTSLLNKFLHREKHTTGIQALDELLADSYSYLLYQESIMKFLVWCGLPEDQTYDIIKKIAKKKFKEHELIELKAKLIDGFTAQTGNEEGFADVWQVVEDAAHYSFNASHSLSVAWDGLYGAYLKSNYPLEFYTVVLNEYESDTDKTSKITAELPHFGISVQPVKFRNSRAGYSFDKVNNRIYKGIASIKFLNAQVAEELYALRDKQYATFTDLLVDVTENTSANSKQTEILIKLDFFSEFGQNGKLLAMYQAFSSGELQYKKTYVQKTKDKRLELLYQHETTLDDKPLPIVEQLQAEKEYLGFLSTKLLSSDPSYAIITNVNNNWSPRLTVYHLNSGEEKIYKMSKQHFLDSQGIPLCSEWDIIKIKSTEHKPKMKKADGKWIKLDETEEWITSCSIPKSK